MSTVTQTFKGQITNPADIRNALQLDAGDRVEFVQISPDRFEFVTAHGEVGVLKGMIGKTARKVSVQIMNAAIAKHGESAK